MSATSAPPHIGPDQVTWLSVEGGGAAGMTVHPGLLHALEDLQVLRFDTARRQVGIRGFAGSSSGSIIATLASCGYRYSEVATLLSPPAFDLIFRTEPLQLGEHVQLNGGVKQLGVATGSWPSPLADPVGCALGAMTYGQATAMGWLTGPSISSAIKDSLNRRWQRIKDGDSSTHAFGPAALWEDVKAEAGAAIAARLRSLVATVASTQVVDMVSANYPLVLALLLERMLDRTTWSFDHPKNLMTIMRYDFGWYAGYRWREFIDLAVAFALFRVARATELPTLQVPSFQDFGYATSMKAAFCAEVAVAMKSREAEAAAGGPVTADYVTEFLSYRSCTFARHQALLYDWLPDGSPAPLALTAANLSSQESHIFSADTTPDMYVSDAVRISSGLPPIFKPYIIDASEIPGWWNVPPDSTSEARPFLEGRWMDGGTYYNSPMDVYRPWEDGSHRVLGAGIGIPQRRDVSTVSTWYGTIFDPMARSVYERNISPTRIDSGAFIPCDNFGIGIAAPTQSEEERAYYRLDAWSRTMNFFGGTRPTLPPEFLP